MSFIKLFKTNENNIIFIDENYEHNQLKVIKLGEIIFDV